MYILISEKVIVRVLVSLLAIVSGLVLISLGAASSDSLPEPLGTSPPAGVLRKSRPFRFCGDSKGLQMNFACPVARVDGYGRDNACGPAVPNVRRSAQPCARRESGTRGGC